MTKPRRPHRAFIGAFTLNLNIPHFQVNPRKMLATPSISDDSTIDPKNFATIRTTSIVQRQQKEHLQEEMHDQVRDL